ncbi:MAG: hypothetical protein ACO4B6_04700, partial [Ilumatobacteraceae bacterium]
MIRETRRAIRALGLAGLLAGCGLPIDERVQTLDEVPFDLATPTTTSTTTTTTEPPVREPEESEPVEETTTTIVRTVPVDIAYVLGG